MICISWLAKTNLFTHILNITLNVDWPKHKAHLPCLMGSTILANHHGEEWWLAEHEGVI